MQFFIYSRGEKHLPNVQTQKQLLAIHPKASPKKPRASVSTAFSTRQRLIKRSKFHREKKFACDNSLLIIDGLPKMVEYGWTLEFLWLCYSDLWLKIVSYYCPRFQEWASMWVRPTNVSSPTKWGLDWSRASVKLKEHLFFLSSTIDTYALVFGTYIHTYKNVYKHLYMGRNFWAMRVVAIYILKLGIYLMHRVFGLTWYQ